MQRKKLYILLTNLSLKEKYLNIQIKWTKVKKKKGGEPLIPKMEEKGRKKNKENKSEEGMGDQKTIYLQPILRALVVN